MKLLRTPTAAEVEGGPVSPEVAKAKGQTLRLTGQILALLPTPATTEPGFTVKPVDKDGKPTTKPNERWYDPETGRLLQKGLTQVLREVSWGEFTLAIKRWEKILGRPAPEPTLPDGQKGQNRLSSKFTEWLMGVPEGWITGHGLHRKDEIKMAGNGVVPQQAKLALDILKARLNGD